MGGCLDALSMLLAVAVIADSEKKPRVLDWFLDELHFSCCPPLITLTWLAKLKPLILAGLLLSSFFLRVDCFLGTDRKSIESGVQIARYIFLF